MESQGELPNGSVEKMPPEVDVGFAARYLGTTERTIINYLKARQLSGEKVGKKWFIKSESLLRLRPYGTALEQAVLPSEENPKSIRQHENENRKNRRPGKDWNLVKSSKRNPANLNGFAHVVEALDILERNEEDFHPEQSDFFKNALMEIGDDLGAGYYSFGLTKRKLYARARIRSGRLVSRALLQKAPKGLTMILCQVAEAVSFLCRSLEKKSLRPKAAESSQKPEEKTHVTA